MNTKEMTDMLSTLLADSSTNFYTTNERLQALNNACRYLNSELRILRNVVSIPFAPTDVVIPMPSDFVALGKGIEWTDSSGIVTALERRVHLQMTPGWDTETGTPSEYVLEGSNIHLYPQPTQAGTVTLSYVAMPNALINDADVPFYGDLRTQAHHDAIVFYAAWMLTLKDRDFEAAQQFMGYFQARMIDLKENLRHTGDVSVQPVWSDTYSSA